MKKILILAVVMCMLVTSVPPMESNAEYDVTGKGMGIYISSEDFGKVWWTKTILTQVKIGEKVMGEAQTRIGVARQKDLMRDEYLDLVVTHTVMEPEAGMSSDFLRISANMGNGQELFAAYPENTPDTGTYTLEGGVEIGTGGISLGVSSSTTYTVSNLEVSNLSSVGKRRYDVLFDYIGKTKASYRMKPSVQRTLYYINGRRSNYTVPLEINVGFVWRFSDFGEGLEFAIDNLQVMNYVLRY